MKKPPTAQFRQIVAEVSPEDMQDPQKYEFLEAVHYWTAPWVTYGYHTAAHISDYYIKHGQIERARALQENITPNRCLHFPGWEANAVYNLGCFYSAERFEDGSHREIEGKLSRSSPTLWTGAKQDSDIDPLRGMVEYKQLVGE